MGRPLHVLSHQNSLSNEVSEMDFSRLTSHSSLINSRKDKTMYHIYTIKNKSEFSKTLVAETKDYDEALEKAEKAIAGKEGYNYVVEETDGSMNSYGELLTTVVAEG